MIIKKIHVNTNSYDVIIGDNILDKIDSYTKNSKVFVITDSNLLKIVSEKNIKYHNIYVVDSGEYSKNYNNVLKIIDELIINEYSRFDYIVSIGGGVVGDLSGFISSIYKRGINHILIPTSTLSMIDSSIGGKTAINYHNTKNVIGSFYSPNLVIIDFEFLKSLPKRHFYAGLIEGLKMGFTSSKKLVSLFDDIDNNYKDIIISGIMVKKKIVEEDYQDRGRRAILNFGHSIAHAIEIKHGLIHGEAVAIGMRYFIDKKEDRDILDKYLGKMGIDYNINISDIMRYIVNDKKVSGSYINEVFVPEIGKSIIKKIKITKIKDIIEVKK